MLGNEFSEKKHEMRQIYYFFYFPGSVKAKVRQCGNELKAVF